MSFKLPAERWRSTTALKSDEVAGPSETNCVGGPRVFRDRVDGVEDYAPFTSPTSVRSGGVT